VAARRPLSLRGTDGGQDSASLRTVLVSKSYSQCPGPGPGGTEPQCLSMLVTRSLLGGYESKFLPARSHYPPPHGRVVSPCSSLSFPALPCNFSFSLALLILDWSASRYPCPGRVIPHCSTTPPPGHPSLSPAPDKLLREPGRKAWQTPPSEIAQSDSIPAAVTEASVSAPIPKSLPPPDPESEPFGNDCRGREPWRGCGASMLLGR
jgi:hypothetical protein